MFTIAYATPKDTAAVMALWGAAFGVDEPYFSWYFNNVYQADRTLCLFSDNIMAASLQYAPYTLRLHGEELDIAYLVGVCTGQAYQGRGFAHALINDIIRDLRRTYRLLMLSTDIPDFYRPFGFIHCYYLRRHTLRANPCPDIMRQWDIGLLTEAELDHCARIYQKMTTDLDGYIIRSKTGWRHFFEDFLGDGGSLYLNPDAYLLWLIEDGVCKIKEIGYADGNALYKALDLAKHIAATRGFSAIVWDAPLAAPLAITNTTVLPHVMVLSCEAVGHAAEIAEQTKKRFGNPKNLWVNEIT